jgi:hypothetical protein
MIQRHYQKNQEGLDVNTGLDWTHLIRPANPE